MLDSQITLSANQVLLDVSTDKILFITSAKGNIFITYIDKVSIYLSDLFNVDNI